MSPKYDEAIIDFKKPEESYYKCSEVKNV